MVNINIKELESNKELELLRKFLLEQSLGYPNYEAWVECVCIPELERSYKKAYLAFYYGHLVGDAIFQPHKELSDFIEFKNLRIHPEYRGRYLGLFLARQIEVENNKNIICDTREKDIVELLKRLDYREIAVQSLYDSNTLDIVMMKEINSNLPRIILPALSQNL